MSHDHAPPAERRSTAWPDWPELDEQSAQAMVRALRSGRLAVSGGKSVWPSQTVSAARTVARMSGRRHCVLTTSGSTSIVVALHALGIGPGDTVAMTAATWVACATSVLRVGATPVFFDATPESPCGDPATLAERPSAILGIHLFAQHFDVAAARARFPGVPIVEDASHTQFGLTADGSRIGSLGDLSIMSLQASKIITSGEGGAILTDDEDVLHRLESLVMDSRRRAALNSPIATTELEPANLLHGSNQSPPEHSAALLADQLARFAGQAERRARGARTLAAALDGSGWTFVADEAALADGSFYGIVLRIPAGVGTPTEVMAAVQRETGLVISTVYDPITEGPLYRPETIKQFAGLRPPATALPHTGAWFRHTVLVPHAAFLAEDADLRRLAAVLRAMETGDPVTALGSPVAATTVDVVVITRGDRDTLGAALASAVKQDTDADVRITVWVDGDRAPSAVAEVPCEVITLAGQGLLPDDPFARIAALRDLAAARCTADHVAFLDDDNEWEANHLSSLLTLARAGHLAVHSWRTLVGADGLPATVDRFPWLAPSPEAEALLGSLGDADVLDADSPVVRDRAVIDGVPGLTGMVDMGEWLFDREALRLLRFGRPRTPAEVAARVGEDDIVLEQLNRLEFPVGCTSLPTLRYRLGGMSTPEYRAGTE
ncbi:glycosyltransferase [Solihabitans fulvus]|uniref:Glycosyltransferase n=1 Tax=Solihabitans fulvus TaxID=1892852 RepID=A0A5B2XMK3_9PSEU|nr:DegT/DnrJ/EryC1/StrS family aminotransferase [Solihabitans fulvus]KAA2264184.1 glycosyltransferase [Solihabitans fulvus]